MLSHKGTEAINTNRLLLRRFELNDAYDMFRNWANDSEVTKFVSWKPHSSVEATKEILEKWVNEYKNNIYNWTVELKETGEVIGSITNNVASGKVMIKSGMNYEGTLRQVETRDNKEFYDLAVYSILKNDWLIKNKQSS